MPTPAAPAAWWACCCSCRGFRPLFWSAPRCSRAAARSKRRRCRQQLRLAVARSKGCSCSRITGRAVVAVRRAGAATPDATTAAVVPQAGQLPGQAVPPLAIKTEAGLFARLPSNKLRSAHIGGTRLSAPLRRGAFGARLRLSAPPRAPWRPAPPRRSAPHNSLQRAASFGDTLVATCNLAARSRQCARKPGTTGETAGVLSRRTRRGRQRPAVSWLGNGSRNLPGWP